jgi:iron(III) transport system permease protein
VRPLLEKTLRLTDLLFYSLVVFLPLTALVGQAGELLARGEVGGLLNARQLNLLARSASMAAAVALLTTLLGTLAAVILWRRGGAVRWLLFLLAPLPPYIHALAWMTLAARLGFAASGEGLSIWVQALSLLPLATALALVGLDSVESGLVDAGRLARPDIQALIQVVLPLAAPAILTGAGLCFLFSLTDYSVPSLFQVSTYSMEIFSEFSASSQPGRAFLLALPLLALTGIVILSLIGSLRALAENSTAGNQPPVAFCWPIWFRLLLAISGLVGLIQAGAPLGMLGGQAGSWERMVRSVTAASGEIGFTLLVAGAAALLCLPLGLAVGSEMQRNDWRGRLAWGLALAPLAVPGPLVGIGLIAIWNRDLPLAIYGTGWMPILAMLARFSALAALLTLAQLRRVDPHLLEAADIFQTGLLKSWLGVRLPLLLPGLLAAAGVVFILSSGELGSTLIVAPPGQATLTMRIYNYLHYGATDTVAGLGLLMAVGTLGIGAAVAGGFKLRRGT